MNSGEQRGYLSGNSVKKETNSEDIRREIIRRNRRKENWPETAIREKKLPELDLPVKRRVEFWKSGKTERKWQPKGGISHGF